MPSFQEGHNCWQSLVLRWNRTLEVPGKALLIPWAKHVRRSFRYCGMRSILENVHTHLLSVVAWAGNLRPRTIGLQIEVHPSWWWMILQQLKWGQGIPNQTEMNTTNYSARFALVCGVHFRIHSATIALRCLYLLKLKNEFRANSFWFHNLLASNCIQDL